MATTARAGRPRRFRVGRVSVYRHHGAWWLYFREAGRPRRRRCGQERDAAEQAAARLNAELTCGRAGGTAALVAGEPAALPTVLPALAVAAARPGMAGFARVPFERVAVDELVRRWLAYHEQVRRSSLATISRYRSAVAYLARFSRQPPDRVFADEVSAAEFVSWLRAVRVAPNGHPRAKRRSLRDKGVRFILETCRSLYNFAVRGRLLPPGSPNPFAELGLERMQVEDSKPLHVFSAAEELAFLQACDDLQLPIFALLAQTGLRPGELTHLLIEDVDLAAGWIHIRNKQELGWRIKTRAERSIPISDECRAALRRVIGSRTAGVVFLRGRYARGALPPLAGRDRHGLAAELERRVATHEAAAGERVDRVGRARLAAAVWRDAGALEPDRIRTGFIAIAARAGLAGLTCPKAWRHTVATTMQQVNMDPLVRQVVLGHAGGDALRGRGVLGMTAHYTHTSAETVRQQMDWVLAARPLTRALITERTGEIATGTFRRGDKA